MDAEVTTRSDGPPRRDPCSDLDAALHALDDAVAALDLARWAAPPAGRPEAVDRALDQVDRSLATCFAVGVASCVADRRHPHERASA